MMQTFPHFEPRFPFREWVLPHILEKHATERADAPFLQWTDVGEPLSFAEVNRLANRLAHGFAQLGVGQGDFIAIFLPNCLEYPLIWFGLNKLGAVEVTVGPASRGNFLRHPLALARAKMVVTTAGLAARLAEIEDQLPDCDRVILLDDPEEGEVAPPQFSRMAVSRYEDLLSARDDNPGVQVGPRDAAAVLFTSGTTGPSKAVLLPHSQLYWFAEEMIQVCKLTEDDVYLTGFPFFHANAQLESIYPALAMGIRCVLYRKFSAGDWIGRVRRSGATVTNLLGATLAFVCSQPERDDDRDHKLRCVFTAPMPDELTATLLDRYGIEAATTGFGQTEIAMPFLSPWGVPVPAGSCGVLLDQWYEVRLEDPATGEAIEGPGAGELLLRPRAHGIISEGFFGMPDKTVEAWRDLWFHTGDLIRRDADGWYYFVDRLKDTLRRRGENISSFEVEDTVRSFAAVAECACVGVPADEEGGEEEVMVFVLPAEGASVDPAALIGWCVERMPGFAVPRYIEVVESLPETPSGKVKKGELRDRGVTGSTWDRVQQDAKRKGRA